MGNHARGVAKQFSGFVALTMKPTIVLAAKPAENFWQIEVSRDCCGPIGRVRWMNLRL
jgi:hypothetical protein